MTTQPDALLHDWHIEEREYLRHEQRRGRRHGIESLDPTRTALVVVDMVPFFVESSPYCRGIVPQVNLLAAELRAAGGTVAWVVPGPHGAHRPRARAPGRGGRRAVRPFRWRGDPAERVWPGLGVDAQDLAVEKTAHSAFFPGRSPLPDLLAARGIDTVVVTGTVTNVCVEGSVRDAATLGLRVILVADGCAAMRDQDHNATLHVVYRTFGDVRSAAEVVDLVRACAPVPR